MGGSLTGPVAPLPPGDSSVVENGSLGACLDGMLGTPGRCPVSFGRGAGSFLRSAFNGGRLDPPMGGRGGALAGPIVLAIGGRGLVVSNGGEAELVPSPVPSVPSIGEADFFGIGFPLRGPFPLSSGMDVSCWFMGVSRLGIIAPGRGYWTPALPGSLPRARPACTARPAPRRGRRTERVSTRDGASPDTTGRDGSPYTWVKQRIIFKTEKFCINYIAVELNSQEQIHLEYTKLGIES